VIDEPLIRTQLERLMPAPSESRRDWGDVLRRAGHARRRRAAAFVVGFVLFVGALMVAAPALGLHPAVFGEEPTPSWTWPEGVPGEPIRPSRFVESLNAGAHGRFADQVDLRTLRQIAAVGEGYGRSSFLAARGVNGDVCLAKLAGYAGSSFECLHDPPKPGVPSTDERAVLIGMSMGGHRGSVVDYASLIGVARADVGRVELELVDGETIELPLNRWRGFGYYVADSHRFPKTLRVYRMWSSFFSDHEKLVGELPLQEVNGLTPTPLCGGGYGPCPPGVKP
jgi:hypothetical protein